MSDPRRILLVRTSAMGDIVHCLPFLAALRRRFPDARVGWVVEKVWAPILAGHPDIDELIPVRTKAWRKNLLGHETRAELGAVKKRLRDFRADLTFDLMGNLKGAVLARGSRAPRIVGAAASCRRESLSARFMTDTVDLDAHGVGIHAIDRALGLLVAVDAYDPGAAVDLGGERLLTEVPEAAEPVLASLDARRPLVLIQAGAGWGNKIYPQAWWGEVARQLAAAGYDVVLPTAPGEVEPAESIVQHSDGAARTVDGTDFRLAAALMRRARLLLGGDTGPVHLAHALGTPVLSVIGPTDPARNGPYRAPGNVLFHPLPCSFCYKRFASPRACLLSIPPRQVVSRALELLVG